MDSEIGSGAVVSGKANMKKGINGESEMRGFWKAVCRDKHGAIKWVDEWENAVVLSGLDHMLDVGLSGATQQASWFIGLTDGTPTVVGGDTMASHAGWAEVVAYTEANRVPWVDGGVASQSVDNSASPATFSINANTTVIGGAFLVNVNAKGGVTGILYAAGAFTLGDKSLDAGDSLDVTATFTSTAV